MHRRPPRSTRTYTLFPDTTLFRSDILQILISDRDAVVRGVTKEDAFALIDEFSKRYDAESNLSFSAIFLSPDDSKAFGWYRSEERRVGKECVSTCRSGWSPYH